MLLRLVTVDHLVTTLIEVDQVSVVGYGAVGCHNLRIARHDATPDVEYLDVGSYPDHQPHDVVLRVGFDRYVTGRFCVAEAVTADGHSVDLLADINGEAVGSDYPGAPLPRPWDEPDGFAPGDCRRCAAALVPA